MSIRQEHLDAYDNAMSSFKENMELAKSMTGGGAQALVERGLGLVQQVAGGVQQFQQFKALLAKGQNVAKVGQKVVNNAIDKVKGNATNPEATTEATEATTEATDEIPADVVRPASTIASNVSNAGNVAEESSGTMSNLAEDASNIDEMPASESLLASLEAQGASQAAQDVAQIQPISMAGDSLAPMRAIMGSRAVGEGTASQLQQNIADFDPEGDITDLGTLSTRGATQAISSGVGNLTESGEGLSAVGEGLASTVSGTASTVSGAASEAGAGLASTLSSTVTPLAAETGAELGSLAIPGIGEAVGVIAGIASFITSLIPPKDPPPVQELGADFSNNDEHSGAANAAY